MSGGTSNPAAAPLTLSTPPALLPTRRARTAARSADGLQSFGEGDIMKLQLDTRTDTVDSSGQTLASTKAMLTVYKNGQEHTGYDNVPVRSLRRVPARCGACPHAAARARTHCATRRDTVCPQLILTRCLRPYPLSRMAGTLRLAGTAASPSRSFHPLGAPSFEGPMRMRTFS